MTIQDVWEAVGAEERGLIPRAELDELERVACPGAGTCAGHFTANTMAVALDCLGIARIGDGLIPADEPAAKDDAAARAGTLAAQLAGAGPTARTFLDRRALLNAMAGIAATGGSTNGILHLLAIAQEAGVALTLDELAAIGSAHAGDREPRARRAASWPRTCTASAARPSLIRELVRGGQLDGDAPTVDGSTLADVDERRGRPRRRGAVHARRAVQADRRAARAARQPRARREPRQARRRPTASHRGPGARLRQRGGVHGRRARGRRGRRVDVLVVRYEGPAGGPGHARDAERHGVGRRRGARRVGRARHRRALLRRHARADGRPRRAGGGARRPARDRPRRRPDHDRRRRRDADARARRRRDRGAPRRLDAPRPPVRRRRLRAATARWSAPRPRAPCSSRETIHA